MLVMSFLKGHKSPVELTLMWGQRKSTKFGKRLMINVNWLIESAVQ